MTSLNHLQKIRQLGTVNTILSSKILTDNSTTKFSVDQNSKTRVISGPLSNLPPLGPTTSGSSISVVLASDQPTLSVDYEAFSFHRFDFIVNAVYSETQVTNYIYSGGCETMVISLSFTGCPIIKGTVYLQASNIKEAPEDYWTTLVDTAYNINVVSTTNSYGVTLLPISIAYKYVRILWQSKQAPIQRITTRSDVGYSLAGKYFLVHWPGISALSDYSSDFSENCYVYYIIDGFGIPASPPHPYILINVNVNATAETVAIATTTALNSICNGGAKMTDKEAALSRFVIENYGGAVNHRYSASIGTNQLIMQNGNATVWYSSNDGDFWNNTTNGSIPTNIIGLRALNGLYVAYGNSVAIFTSPNGQIWTARSTGGLYDVTGVEYDSDHNVWVALSAYEYKVSLDNMATWTSYLLDDLVKNKGLRYLSYNSDTWYAVGPGMEAMRCVGTPGVGNGFTNIFHGYNYQWKTILPKTGGAGFIAFSTTNITMVTDFDTNIWILTQLPIDTAVVAESGCVYCSAISKYVLPTIDYIYDSTDGINWDFCFNRLNLTANPLISSCSTGFLIIMNEFLEIFRAVSTNNDIVLATTDTQNGCQNASDIDTGFTINQLYPSATPTVTISSIFD